MQRHLPLKRAVSLVAGLLLVGWVITLLTTMQKDGQATLQNEARGRAQALLAYAVRDTARWLKEDNHNELARLAQDLASEPEIRDVTLYDNRGILLAQSEQALPLESVLPIGSDNQSIPAQGKGRSQYVQEVMDDDSTLGYLRITLEERQIVAKKDAWLKLSQERQRLMLLVTLLAGLLISYGVRRNYVRVLKHKKQKQNSKTAPEQKTAEQPPTA